MKLKNLEPVDCKNAGDAREWSICNAFGCTRTKHDSVAYDKASDLTIGDMRLSVKASAFSLMAGSLCEGLTDFDDIWNLYESKTHSNTFAYVTKDWKAYLMNIAEFKSFVYTFCITERESSKNGGATKIRCRKESGKMLEWLAAQVAS